MKKIIKNISAITLLIANLVFVSSAYALDNKKVQPVEISAAESLEWHKKEQRYTVKKDVVVTQSDLTIQCDELTAYYKSDEDFTDITILEADQNVKISSPPYTAFGDNATYDIISGKAVLRGNTVSVTTEKDLLIAQDRIEFLRDKKKIIAFGRPIVKHELNTISANVMAAYFKEDANGKMISDRMVADGKVVIETDKEKITGDRLVFNNQTRQAIMSGEVVIKQGDNQIVGSKAVVDMNTGISQLLGNNTSTNGTGRVKGVFYPKGKKN